MVTARVGDTHIGKNKEEEIVWFIVIEVIVQKIIKTQKNTRIN